MGEDTKNKTFTFSVDLLLTLILVLSIGAAWAINSNKNRINSLTQRIDFLEEHDVEIQKLKQDLFLKNFKK